MGSRRPSLLISTSDFGYGSSGKLDSILQALAPHDFGLVRLGSADGGVILSVTPDFAYAATSDPAALRDLARRHDVHAALVVGGAQTANVLEDAGIRVVFVDSLPFLWTDEDPVAHRATSYCAQSCIYVPDLAWRQLRRIERLRWVSGIVPSASTTEPARRDSGLAVVNLGGVGSPMQPPEASDYASVVLPPVLAALARVGFREAIISGSDRARWNHASANVETLRVTRTCSSHGEFQMLLRRAGVLLTSPGLTTLLEAAAAETPTVVLPPQNVSQFLNARAVGYAAGRDVLIDWPSGTVSFDQVDEWRERGELAALGRVYEAIAAARHSSEVGRALSESTERRVLRVAGDGRVLEPLRSAIGTAGAREVAEVVLGLMSGSNA